MTGLDLLARAAAALGDETRAEAAAAELEEIAAAVATDPLRGAALVARGLAVAQRDPDAARRALEDAANLLERSSMPYEAAHARIALARVLATAGRGEAARAECFRAAAIFERLGASAGRELAERETPGNERLNKQSPLTARELEVLGLVAAGLADKEVADRLGLSPHTVHRHVSNVLTKLGLPSRSAAVAHVTRLGLLN